MQELLGSFAPYAKMLLAFFIIFWIVGWLGQQHVMSLADQKKVTGFRRILVVGYGALVLIVVFIHYLGNLNFRPPA